MTQEEAWQLKYNEVVAFIKTHHRNPSRYDDTERGRYVNWLKHNRKLFNAGTMKEERMEMFKNLLELMEDHKRTNQYQ